ncbi:response regulator [Tenuifilum osseticum]|uniref:response regulator n=1 Tax=Tenuifilum osseticum TaxID=3374723 RepID=UPI0034E56D5A
MSDPVNNAMGLAGKRILIVDDDTVSRIFLRELLVQSGAVLDFVRNGYELQKYIGSNPEPDVILIDVKLPDADGVELAAQLLAKKPGLRVVAETAYAIEGLDEKCRDYGLKGCVYKPINKDELLKLLLKVVE